MTIQTSQSSYNNMRLLSSNELAFVVGLIVMELYKNLSNFVFILYNVN